MPKRYTLKDVDCDCGDGIAEYKDPRDNEDITKCFPWEDAMVQKQNGELDSGNRRTVDGFYGNCNLADVSRMAWMKCGQAHLCVTRFMGGEDRVSSQAIVNTYRISYGTNDSKCLFSGLAVLRGSNKTYPQVGGVHTIPTRIIQSSAPIGAFVMRLHVNLRATAIIAKGTKIASQAMSSGLLSSLMWAS